VEKHGPTGDCDGCTRAIIGDTQRPHTENCRERFEEILHREGDPRILREVDRLEGQQEIARRMVESEPLEIKTDEDEQMEIEEEIDEEKNDEDMVLRLGEIMRMAYDEELEEKSVGRSQEAGKRRKNWRSDADKMDAVLKLENVDTAILEIYSPTRINAVAEM